MVKLLRTRLLWVALFIAGAFLLSGCYTQLAKPEAKKVETRYYEETEPDYSEEEYVEEEVAYAEDAEEVHVYHHYAPYYGYYGTPWWFDPFYDPFFYDYYYPYSSHVSIHVGFYDPFYFSYFYYPFSYRYRSYYYGFGCWRPVRGYFVPYYPGSYVNVNTVPYKQRGFTRRGTQTEDDLGYRPGRVSVNNSGNSGGSSVYKPATSSSGDQAGRSPRRVRREAPTSGKIEKTDGTSSGAQSNANNGRRVPKSVEPKSAPQPESNAPANNNSNSGDSSKRRSGTRRESKQSLNDFYRPVVNREVAKPASQSNGASKTKGRIVRTRTAKGSTSTRTIKATEYKAPKSSPSKHSYSSSNRGSSKPSPSVRSSSGGGYKSSGSSSGSKSSSSSGRRSRR